MEAAAQMIVNAAGRHLVERHASTMSSSRRAAARAARHAAAAADPSDAETSAPGQSRRARDRTLALERRRRRSQQTARRAARRLDAGRRPISLQVLGQLARPASTACSRRFFQASATASRTWSKPGMPMRAVRRPIGAAVKRLQVGRQKHRHRPAAAAGHHLHGVHVDLIEVGPLLAIDLDADEVARSSAARSPRFSKLSCSITWHQWQAE